MLDLKEHVCLIYKYGRPPLQVLRQHQWRDLVIVCVVIRSNTHFTSTTIKYLIYLLLLS